MAAPARRPYARAAMSDDGSGASADFACLDAWVDANFEDEVRFLQALVRVPTDTQPGDNAPHDPQFLVCRQPG